MIKLIIQTVINHFYFEKVIYTDNTTLINMFGFNISAHVMLFKEIFNCSKLNDDL